MTRRDYGPQGCAERSAALIGVMGIGAYLVGLVGKLAWRTATAVLRLRESRRS